MIRARSGLLALGVLAAACSGDGIGAGEVLVVAQIEINPPGAGLVVGGTQQMTASPRTSSGIPVPGREVTWSSSNEAIATVSASGLVTAVALGRADITARVDQTTASVPVNVSPKPVASVTLSPPSANLVVGQSLPLEAVALDGQGEPLSDRPFTFLSDNPAVATVSTSGVVVAIGAGETMIRARAEGKEGTSSISVAPRPATRLAFTTQPSNATAGQAFGPLQVTVQDEIGGTVTTATNSITLALSDNPGDGSLAGPVTVAAVAGVATFNDLVINKAATGYTLRATSGSLSPAISNPFAIAGGAAAALEITTEPEGAARSGVPLAQFPVVQVQDALGNNVGQPGVQVAVAVTPAGASASGTTSATTNASGAATFTGLILSGTPGTYQLRFTAAGLTEAVSRSIMLASSSLALVTQPSGVATNGAPLPTQPVVRIMDGSGNPVTQGGIAVSVALVGTGGTLSGVTTINTNGSGIAGFSGLAITGTAGTFQLAFSAPGLAPVTSAPITLNPGQATQVRIAVQPGPSAQSGAALNPQPEIQVADQSGNPVSTSGISLTASLATGTGTLGGTLTRTTNASGRAVFTNLAITGPSGGFTLRFTTAALGSVTSDPVTLGAGSATQLSITAQPSSTAQSGVAFAAQPSVQLRDGANNPVAVAGVTVTASIASGGGTLQGTATAVSNGSGLATFSNLAISGFAGNRTLQFGAGGVSPVASNTIAITPGPASRLALTAQPSPTASSGTPFAQQPVLQIQDAAGNNVAQSTTPITAAIETGAGGVLGGALIVLTNASGQATYANLQLTGTSGNYTLRFTASGLTPVISIPVALGAGAGSKLSITTQPSASAQNGESFPQQPVIQLRDASDNPVAQAGVQVAVTILSGGGSLSGTIPVATNASGQATFTNLTITGTTGDRTLILAATGYSSVTSNPVSITPGDPAALEITTQPSATAASGAPLAQQPVIHLEDQSGNAVSQAGVLVTATLASGGGSLSNATASTNGSGVATFAGLAITGTAGNKTLGFGATGLTGTTSGTIALGAGGASQIGANSATSQSAVVGTAVGSPPSVIVTDGAGNPVSGVSVTFTVTAGGGSMVPASPATVATNGSGVATLTSWTLGSGAGTGNNTVTAAAAGLNGSPVSFTGSGTAGAATTMQANSATSQSATAGTAVGAPPSVLVSDNGGNPVSGVNVTFTVTGGGGSTSPASPAVVATNGSGIAALTSWTLGAGVGSNNNTVSATAGLGGSPVIFTASGVVGSAENIAANSNTSQSATIGTPVGEPPTVLVTDAGGNPVSGVNVTFTVTGGGGSISPASPAVVATNASGVAAVSSWTLGTTAGTGNNAVSATAAGLSGSPVSFTASATAGDPENLDASSALSQSAQVGSAVGDAPSVRVTDGEGNPVAGVSVTFEVTEGGGSVNSAGSATVVTNASGAATLTSWVLGTVAGANRVTATAAGLTGSPVTFTATGTPGPAASLSILVQPPGTVGSGVTLTPAPKVEVRDAHNNLVAPTTVSVELVPVLAVGGDLDGDETVSTVNGVATFDDLAINGLLTYRLRFVVGELSVESNSINVTL